MFTHACLSSSQRRSSLTFKGPAAPTRSRKPPSVLDPIVPSRPLALAKRRRSSTGGAHSHRTSRSLPVTKARRASAGSQAQPQSARARKPSKRARVPDSDDDDDQSSASSDPEDDGAAASTRPYERRVARQVVAKRWRLLSASARDDVRFLAEHAARECVEEAFPHDSTSKAARALTTTLASFADDIDSLLVSLPVPPVPTVLARNSKGRAREVDLGVLMREKDLRRKSGELAAALEAEEAIVEALEAKVDEQRRLLEQEEALVASLAAASTRFRSLDPSVRVLPQLSALGRAGGDSEEDDDEEDLTVRIERLVDALNGAGTASGSDRDRVKRRKTSE
ncbi:hypothetical protein Rhopal_006665-T1 [Rhodotorula paludigena]|uniref:Uncharacterized protein n=1 Tax=Rhodotorula paludigena TaxID=86838 RepID=A0AAV5GYM1_9BASI|nr:hypothetical protein Rhopal_006665-T1 [Rhodotorula paludigena]